MSSLLQENLFETCMQAPSPSRDYYQLIITKNEVIWKTWKISFRVDPSKNLPRESRKPHSEFLVDEQLQGQIKKIFGEETLEYILNLCCKHFDFLVRMPDKLIIHIMSFLNAEDIMQLSKTSTKFKKLCNSDEFLEKVAGTRHRSEFKNSKHNDLSKQNLDPTGYSPITTNN
ncbi:F-box only protein 36-like [Latimeria chalumnae]|uniref:F-box only protein 36-like n=1 Tax=Latimeria chalumnae TaxID=7897 RepID=UPI0006D92F46|nr:PREDICTED: F-box only protein 36-like [Latimeria chalumnae]|eukprot:XP_006011758.2 PREDICTED: F-box only protein 36-like [Latimeria chalumnae]